MGPQPGHRVRPSASIAFFQATLAVRKCFCALLSSVSCWDVADPDGCSTIVCMIVEKLLRLSTNTFPLLRTVWISGARLSFGICRAPRSPTSLLRLPSKAIRALTLLTRDGWVGELPWPTAEGTNPRSEEHTSE